MHPLTQLCRCFIQPIEEPPEQKQGGGGGGGGERKHRTWRDAIPQGILEALRPYAHPSLTFDVETTVDAQSGQRAKVGFFQEHGLRYAERCALFAEGLLTPERMDVCWREGVFYNPAICTTNEVRTITDYAAKRGLVV